MTASSDGVVRSATPLVLLHGATSSPRAWDSVIPSLGLRYEVWAPGLAGHRGGPPLALPRKDVVEGIVDTLCREFDHRRIEKAHVVGNSLGGRVALELARRDRAASVLALSPAAAWRSRIDLTVLLARFRLAALTRNSTVLHRMLRQPRLRRVLLRATAEHCDRLTTEQADAMVEDLIGCDILADLLASARVSGPIAMFDNSVGCPVRIVWSERDRTLPFARYGAPLIKAVPSADLAVLSGVGHVPMIDDPALVARTILEFLDTVESGPDGPQSPS